MAKAKAVLHRPTVLLLVLVIAGGLLATAGAAIAGCVHVVAGPDDCTVCERYYMVGDTICYENYYYCYNSQTQQIDGYYNDRCEPWD